MTVLVIPDVHLKPWMFDRAEDVLQKKSIDNMVCLMDIPDDWGQECNIGLYEETYDRAIEFAKKHSDSLWCYGNHDLSYMWRASESGYSYYAEEIVYEKLIALRKILTEQDRIKYIHRIDNVLFMHGGLTDEFVKAFTKPSHYNDVDAVISGINSMGKGRMWQNYSPIWLRPQYGNYRMYKPRKLLQVVGHTPVKQIEKRGNVISCDTFSTYRNGDPYGAREFLLLNTKTWVYEDVSIDKCEAIDMFSEDFMEDGRAEDIDQSREEL